MSWIDRALFWLFDRFAGPRLKALTVEDLREEREWYSAEIASLKRRKKRHSHLLPGLQHVTSELLRLEICK
jgi:hypothetical protein